MKLSVDAAAKINLSLDITGKLDNGYHSLVMVMQSVSLFDTVTIEKTTSGTVEMTCSAGVLPCDKRNTAFKAALAFFNDAGIKNEGIKIHIEKRIPMAAGLAGGSADAAAVICGLNALYNTGLCETALCSIGLKVGSDVPFCISGGTKLVENAGEKISPLPAFCDCFIVLAKPEAGVSTKEAYGAFDNADNILHPDNAAIISAMQRGDFDALCRESQNVFEQVIEIPELAEIRSIISERGASLTRMSGSGPTVFGLFTDEEKARLAEKSLKESGICAAVELCRPISFGIKIKK